MIKNQLGSSITYQDGFAPSRYDKPLSLLRNWFFFLKQRFKHTQSLDIYHITGVLHYLFVALPRRRTILTIHDCVKIHQQKGIKKWFAWLLWFKLPCTYFKYITVVSEQTKRELIQLTNCNPDKIIVIHNPLDPAIRYHPKAFNSEMPTVLHIGTAENKNLPRLIKALVGLACRLWIVGRLDKDTITMLTTNQISFENFVDCDDDQIRTLYQQADIVSFVTTYEGFGLPIIEAQATGRVVLTSQLQPHQEIGGEGACYVNPYYIEEIRHEILELIQNTQKRELLIIKGLENVKRFEAAKISTSYLQLYHYIHQTLCAVSPEL
ncbi:MAG: glycosyltransferase family 1 protein [Spirosomataceae bacterium]